MSREGGDSETVDGDETTDDGTTDDGTTDDETRPTGTEQFLVDVMCGTLATYLRFCGYDAAYALDRGVEDDDRIASIAAAEDRTLLTRDRELAERVDGALLLESRDPADQLAELAEAGVTIEIAETPRRCGRCNGRLDRVSDTPNRPAYVPSEGPVWRCRDCGQWFWKGSHWRDVRARIGAARST
ncbi:hypothetical protein SAMN05192561_101437 [Halopenitus malekzadehii]|uniref:Mut7-C RNAse domain-containing protein n=1 Tax=Halopenitus malekzadehii TaxID=1267564 RepID=A0A1H6HTL5_9EURY|nr:Mut7-C RNAse domain-containing protein [Halopenitus malekzadehii]SEH38926.1 hypothetical protein SAMN05192561_101437 [Halopenitus malekzadehii]